MSVGDTVVWENTSGTVHTTTSATGLWDSGNMQPGTSYSHTFGRPGVYRYYCAYHQADRMVGTVIVRSGTPSGRAIFATATSAASATRFVVGETNDETFSPMELRIGVGDTVTWKNTSRVPHTSTSDAGFWDSGNMPPGATYSHTFTRPGVYRYYCQYHRNMGMVGTIIVGPSPTASATVLPGATPGATGTPSRARVVEVEEREYSIMMPRSLPAGPTVFSVQNLGTTIHNFEIRGNGVDEKFPSPIRPGETKIMIVDLRPGTYVVWCPVDSHAEEGMTLRLTVR